MSLEYWYLWHRGYESRYGKSKTRRWRFPEEKELIFSKSHSEENTHANTSWGSIISRRQAIAKKPERSDPKY